MKAPDIVESWLWKPPEEIIERLLSVSSRSIGATMKALGPTRPKDRYYLQARRCAAKRAAANDPILRAMRGAR